ncbi:tetratricopeptide repeat protein [Patescibacteria group bacterium]|nr:tetratricopeptide repeat protein [Patescibacteria group bacterium]MDE1946725.1 tetratricopeptide repeat protein [Patescibacteria group bacterium]MDE2010972.1 tetratricopeptide repeat protein [Patescibacteria group bacterium]MDE2232815.1 tetratricopeptide repeat protein [Patescibacteria group bacterium]
MDYNHNSSISGESVQFNRQQKQHQFQQPPKQPDQAAIANRDKPPKVPAGGLSKAAYYIFLATVILAPIVFIPSQYLALDLAKTVVIVMGVLASAVCYGIVILKEREITLPPKTIFWTSILIAISLVVSSLISIHVGKSLFGQGFEVGTAGFILALFVSALVAFETIRRDQGRTLAVYGILGIIFAVFFVLHALRLLIGPSFLSMSVLTAATSTLLGNWNDLGMFSIMILIISSSALFLLPLTKKMKWIYGIVALSAIASAFLINQSLAWVAAAATFALVSVAVWRANADNAAMVDASNKRSWIKNIVWLPVALAVLSLILAWKGNVLAGPAIQGTNTQYVELNLPWQMTIDIVSGAVKNFPWFGVGPNHFAQAFMAYKPSGFNLTDAWSVEFGSGFGFIPTLFAAEGGIGIVLWILFFVFLGIASAKYYKRLPADPVKRFIAVSSCGAMTFLWIMAILYVPSHAILFLAFVMTGIHIASLVSNGDVKALKLAPAQGTVNRKVILPGALVILIFVAVIWGMVYVKKTIALAYFASGVKDVNSGQDYQSADAAFKKALSFDLSDVYYQALAENDRMEASRIIGTATSSTPEIANKLSTLINAGISAARQAIAYDPTNYYNYVSEARISSLAAQLKIPNAYDNAVAAYTNAIRANPLNPSLYLSLAQTQAAEGKLDDALATLGSALQVKNNYLDAVFFLSQVQAAKGDLPNAIISAQVAVQINPQNPLLYFQLGLLEYNAKAYDQAAQALAKAVELQPQYANAQYFLGLSYVRLNKIADAITQFEDLAKTNPDNQEISFILSNLRAGKSPFADAKPPVTSTPEKRASLPVKEGK